MRLKLGGFESTWKFMTPGAKWSISKLSMIWSCWLLLGDPIYMIFQSNVPGNSVKHSKVISNWKGDSTLAGLFPTVILFICSWAIQIISRLALIINLLGNICINKPDFKTYHFHSFKYAAYNFEKSNSFKLLTISKNSSGPNIWFIIFIRLFPKYTSIIKN